MGNPIIKLEPKKITYTVIIKHLAFTVAELRVNLQPA